jgi:REP element-mobilizing transposase RayT
MTYYKRHLPHWQPEGAEFFITFRLAESLPEEAVKKLKSYQEQLREQNDENLRNEIIRKTFQKYEGLLDKAETGPTWLKEEKIARIVQEALHFYNNKDYDLYAYCIMPNHVHMVFKHLAKNGNTDKSKNSYPVTTILQSIKSYSALECNKILDRTGAFWQSESYDRVIRDQYELENKIRYTLNNPVKARLVQKWEEWPYSYCKHEFINSFR